MKTSRFGRYEIESELGRGGMAVVYRARDVELHRTVALKVLPAQFMHDPSFLDRFRREAHTIAQLEHQAIVPLYDFGEHNDQPYLVMRYMSGGTLADRLKGGPLSLQETSTLLERICTALDKAHANGIVHRDLKPANILFDDEGAPYLSDFGIVRLVDQTNTSTVIGTPQYMAPEQAHGYPVDTRTDIYQMGVILFNALSGRVPFDADTLPAILHKHAYEPVPSIHEFVADLPPSIDVVIGRAMAKEKDSRYQSTAALLAALHDVASGKTLPEVATTVGEPQAGLDAVFSDEQRAGRLPAARQWGLLSGLLVLGLILVAGGSLVWGFLRSAGNGGEVTPTVPVASQLTQEALALLSNGTATASPTAGITATSTMAPSPTSTPTAEPSSTPSPSVTPEPRYRISVPSAPLYSGPGTAFLLVDQIPSGQTVLVLGRTEDARWFNVELRDGTRAWLSSEDAEAVDLENAATIPIVGTAPAPPALAPEETEPATISPTLVATPTTAALADRDGDGIADDADDCPDTYGVSERGGCPFEGPSEPPYPPPATDPPPPPPTEDPYP